MYIDLHIDWMPLYRSSCVFVCVYIYIYICIQHYHFTFGNRWHAHSLLHLFLLSELGFSFDSLLLMQKELKNTA